MTTITGPARLLAFALCSWLDADYRDDREAARFAARTVDAVVRALPDDDALRPILDRHLVAGEPRTGAAAVECVLAIMEQATGP